MPRPSGPVAGVLRATRRIACCASCYARLLRRQLRQPSRTPHVTTIPIRLSTYAIAESTKRHASSLGARTASSIVTPSDGWYIMRTRASTSSRPVGHARRPASIMVCTLGFAGVSVPPSARMPRISMSVEHEASRLSSAVSANVSLAEASSVSHVAAKSTSACCT